MKWFKHDSNALHDAKIEKLIMRYGIEGYGLYFACVEMIAEKLSAENMSFELEHDAELLAHKFHIDSIRIVEMMKYCVELNLFQYSEESNKIFCQALARRVDNTMAQQPEFKALIEGMKTKKVESNLNNLKLLQETCPILEDIRVDKSKEEEITSTAQPGASPSVVTIPKPTKKDRDPRVKSLIDYFFTKFKERRGFDPTVNGAAWGNIFKRLLRESSEETIRMVIDSFFAYDKRTRMSIYDFDRSFDNVFGRIFDIQQRRDNAQRASGTR